MSRLADLQTKIHALTEIQSILGAMKNLAVIEMNKVLKLMEAQLRVSQTIDEALADFEFFYKIKLAVPLPGEQILCVLIGSERGFCGPFNERVIESFQKATENKKSLKVAVIGRKLAMKLEGDSRIELQLDGPNSADEIPTVISELAAKLLPHVGSRWLFIHNNGNEHGSQTIASYPLERHAASTGKSFANAPLLNMQPSSLYPQLLEQYLFSFLHRAFYDSFMAENRERLHHMEGALRQIEKDRTHLSLKLNSERQEAITEELEILMLSASSDST